jgi:nicotinic acid mononucleotide adenylyltransferase
VTFVDQPPLDVSSTALRSALMSGKNVQFLLPEAVIEYIVTNKLYDSSNTDHRGGH